MDPERESKRCCIGRCSSLRYDLVRCAGIQEARVLPATGPAAQHKPGYLICRQRTVETSTLNYQIFGTELIRRLREIAARPASMPGHLSRSSATWTA